nr:hypothetical protein [Tanacetum cinerariifolium]
GRGRGKVTDEQWSRAGNFVLGYKLKFCELARKVPQISMKSRVLTDDVIRSLSALIYCRDLDTTTLRELIESEGRLIPEDPQLGVPRVGILRPPRAYMHDLYDRMGRMEIRQKVIKRMEYRQPYYWDRYQGVYVPLQGPYWAF